MSNYTACSAEEHAAIRERVSDFMEETTGHEKWLGLLTGECKVCGSTIGLRLCAICREPMPSTDELPYGPPVDEQAVHFECAARLAVCGRRVGKFIVFVGGGTAREFRTAALTRKVGT